jgi:hypothetical protein
MEDSTAGLQAEMPIADLMRHEAGQGFGPDRSTASTTAEQRGAFRRGARVVSVVSMAAVLPAEASTVAEAGVSKGRLAEQK